MSHFKLKRILWKKEVQFRKSIEHQGKRIASGIAKERKLEHLQVWPLKPKLFAKLETQLRDFLYAMCPNAGV